jgi:hypothetical protein
MNEAGKQIAPRTGWCAAAYLGRRFRGGDGTAVVSHAEIAADACVDHPATCLKRLKRCGWITAHRRARASEYRPSQPRDLYRYDPLRTTKPTT